MEKIRLAGFGDPVIDRYRARIVREEMRADRLKALYAVFDRAVDLLQRVRLGGIEKNGYSVS